MGRVMSVGGSAVLGVVGLAVAWLLGMRNKGSFVVAAQRRFNRAVINPRMLTTAGKPGADASLLQHTGRTSGRTYETPVGAEPTEDGFVIALVYGPRADWLKNVLAGGPATVVTQGVSHAVGRPEVLPLDAVAHYLPAVRAFRAFGVTEAVRLHKVDVDQTGTQSRS